MRKIIRAKCYCCDKSIRYFCIDETNYATCIHCTRSYEVRWIGEIFNQVTIDQKVIDFILKIRS